MKNCSRFFPRVLTLHLITVEQVRPFHQHMEPTSGSCSIMENPRRRSADKRKQIYLTIRESGGVRVHIIPENFLLKTCFLSVV